MKQAVKQKLIPAPTQPAPRQLRAPLNPDKPHQKNKRRHGNAKDRDIRLKVIARLCYWYGEHLARLTEDTEENVKLRAWRIKSEDARDLDRPAVRAWFEDAIRARLRSGRPSASSSSPEDTGVPAVTYGASMCFRECKGMTSPLPCRRPINHKMVCDCADSSAADGRQFTIDECFEEAAGNDNKARAVSTFAYFDAVLGDDLTRRTKETADQSESSATGLELSLIHI